MGLDMYLNGEKFFWGFNGQRPKEDGFEVKSKTLELGYWRKHPNLHGYIVQEFAEGKDECQEIYLDADAIKKIMAAVENNELPPTTGFFFGATDGTEKPEDLQIFQRALDWLNAPKDEKVSRSVIYRASW